MFQHGLMYDDRDVFFYGNNEDMNTWESLIDHYPPLVDYYFNHLNLHKEGIIAVLVEEKSLMPALLDDPKSVCRYLQPLLGEDAPLEHSICGMVLTCGWLSVGFSIVDDAGLARSVLYLTPVTKAMDVPSTFRPGTKHTYVLSIH
jgi:hypothetical protein